jgi:Fe-S-cluster-containing dehydrogenase component
LIFDMPSCGGCRTCEMACSFKQKEEFAPSISSLKIIDKKDSTGFFVMILEEDGDLGRACDGCEELDIPLCMQFCNKSDDLKEILNKCKEERNKK